MAEGLRKARPDGDAAGAQWDVDMGRSYTALGDSMAWRHVMERLEIVRIDLYSKLIDGGDGADEGRMALQVIDAVQKLPTAMIQGGLEARNWLKETS